MRVKHKSLREHLRQHLDALAYDFARFEINDFANWLAAERGRQICFVGLSLPANLFGAWIRGRHTDYIFFDHDTHPIHAVHIRLHELIHILLGHQTIDVSDMTQWLGETASPAEAAQKLDGPFRSLRLPDRQELEAEIMTSLVHQRVIALAGLEALTRPCRSQNLAQFLEGLSFDR